MIRMILQTNRWLLAALGIFLLFSPVAKAQAPAWSTPEMLGASWFPDIATDSEGNVYVVWAGGDANYDLVMLNKKPAGGRWDASNDIQALPAPAGRYATRPALLIDPKGMLHLSYRGDTIWYSHVPLQKASDAQAWSVPQSIAAAGYFSKLVYGQDQKLHLFFTENVVRAECMNCFHLIHQQSSDGISWSSPVDITPTLEGMAKPQVAVDDQNNIYVVFEAGYGGDLGQLSDPSTVMYVVSRDGGESWSYPQPFVPERADDPSAQARNITIGIDANQRLIVVWWAIPEDIIYYQTSQDQGTSWSQPMPIPGVVGGWSIYQSRLDSFTTATDSAGHLHLVLSGRRNIAEQHLSLLHLTWDGTNWSAPDAITTYQDDVPEWPRIAIANGNQLHVAWFVRDKANLFKSDTTNYRVWYAQGQVNAPYIAPEPIAIPSPTPNPNVEVPHQISAPITSSSILLAEHLRQPAKETVKLDTLMSENDDVSLLVMSLLPTTLLLGVITVLHYRRKKF